MNAKIIAFIFAMVASIYLCQAAELAHPRALCMEPIVRGMCKGDFEMFGYNAETNSCVQFTYGGCDGNDNQFDTLQECEDACVLMY